ncbi:MAG: hypothetical protein ACF8NJ_09485, partial [Phycisphaerales bacterium JB038]
PICDTDQADLGILLANYGTNCSDGPQAHSVRSAAALPPQRGGSFVGTDAFPTFFLCTVPKALVQSN